MKKVIDYLNSKLCDNDTVIIGVSGGPDSMALLNLVMALNKKINIIVAFIDHNTRREIKKEKAYVEKWCLDHQLIFESTKIEDKIEKDFESQARKIRYDFFYDLKDKYNAKYILTAHHKDDLIETILMRLNRGSNLNGYIGIRMEDKDFLRPLLDVSKKEILNFLKEYKIKYFIDKTNFKNIHTRNRFRNRVIPILKKENPKVLDKYMDFSKELSDYDRFVEDYIASLGVISGNAINLKILKNESDFIKRKVIEDVIRYNQINASFEVSRKNTDDILNIMKLDKNCSIDLKDGFKAKKSYDRLIISNDLEYNIFSEVFKDYFENELFKITKVKKSDDNSNFTIRLNSKELKMPLVIRSKINSDKMEVKNSGTQKLKTIFIDNKIPLDKRVIYPIVCDSNGTILWLPGLKKSKFDKKNNEKYDIILVAKGK